MRRGERSKHARLRRSCEDRLAALQLPATYSIAELRTRLIERRGRPLHLIPLALCAAQPCGLWIALDSADFIIFEANTTQPHQEHIIAHELAHIICGHRDDAPLDDATARLIFPNLTAGFVRNMLLRANYFDVQEREAEMTASLILTAQSGATASPHTPALEALGGALGIAQKRRPRW